MNELDIRKKIDLIVTSLIAYFFILCLTFTSINVDNLLENYIILEVIMVMAIITYYTNITMSLILALILDFGYMSYKLYMNLVSQVPLTESTYYWVIILPVTVIMISLFSKNILKLQNGISKLKEENSKLVMIDDNTGVRNERALLIELPIYMRLSKRHNVSITLFILRVKFADKLIKILGKEEYSQLLIQASRVFEDTLREEDVKFILDYKTFAFLGITDVEGAKVVKERLRKNIEEFEFSKEELYKNVKFDIKIGSYTYDNSFDDPMKCIRNAEKELEYDIHE